MERKSRYKEAYIKLRISATKNQRTHDRMATIDLTKSDARWLFLHASFGASEWLKNNKDEHVVNRSFYVERLAAYRRMMVECESIEAEKVECVVDLQL